jgi:hypothetical protein
MDSLLPFLQGTCTPYNMPVYPGAQRKIAISGQSVPVLMVCKILPSSQLMLA